MRPLILAFLLVPSLALADAHKPKADKIAADKLASYRKHLSAGRKLGDQKKWGEAVVEFEAALKDLPLDGRALSELGWAAFAAGDYTKARKANADSVRVAGDLKVKAASLYNLGRVDEATGDKAAAARDYATSLVYRPGNKIVTEALARVQKGSPAAPKEGVKPITCGAEEDKIALICGCLINEVGSEDTGDQAPSCGTDGDENSAMPDPFQILSVQNLTDREVQKYLIVKEHGTWRLVAQLDMIYNPGMAGISEEWELASAKIESHGGHKLLVVHEKHEHTDNDRGINEYESEEDDDLTLCVLGDKKNPTSCPLQIAQSHEYTRDILIDDPEDTEKHKGLPRHEGFTLAVKIEDAGTATVTLQKGKSDERVQDAIGPHKLW